jgi:Glycosyltransferase family 87
MPSRRVAYAIAGCVATILFFSLLTRTESRPQSLLRDFNAFYCAGQAIVQHADPYRNEPLGTCERTTPRAGFWARAPVYLSIPAPLPGYALIPFTALAHLPYDAAAFLWSCVLIASFAVSVQYLRMLLTLPLAVILAALTLSDMYVGVTLGQITPIAIAAIVVAAYALTREKLQLAACACTAAMLEPHMGLAACVALLYFRPKTILPLTLLALFLAGLSVALIGISENIEYLTQVVGAHALSEAANIKQLSLTTLLTEFGIAPAIALNIGALWYASMVFAGIFLARRISQDRKQSALCILLPVACAMIGGPFMHIAQIAAVIPASLLFLDKRPAQMITISAVMLLAVPWPQFASLGTSFPLLAALVTSILTFRLLPREPIAQAMLPLLALALTIIPTELLAPIADPTAKLLSVYNPHALAQTSWSAYVAAVGTQNRGAYDIARLPTFCGLIAFLRAALRTSRGREAGAAGGD